MSKSFQPLHPYYYRPLEGLYLSPSLLDQHLRQIVDKEKIKWDRFGYSVEGRPLHYLEWGEGEERLLVWGQMHGNESTAPKAMIDLFHLLQHPQKDDAELVAGWRKMFKLCFIPQLNPDGAQRYTRRNAQCLDLNRDARQQQTPEMQAFFKLIERFDPHWCFNMHDQRSLFSAGEGKPATLSFLAASADPERTVTPTRLKAMQLIAAIHEIIKDTKPGHFGRYTDAFYPKATGDLLQSLGRPTLLFESGAYPADPERRMTRRLTFEALRAALNILVKQEYQRYRESDYLKIPLNGKGMRDLIIRNCLMTHQQGVSKMDLALRINHKKVAQAERLEQHWELEDVGDLSHLNAYLEREGGRLVETNSLALNKAAHFHLKKEEGDILFKQGLWII